VLSYLLFAYRDSYLGLTIGITFFSDYFFDLGWILAFFKGFAWGIRAFDLNLLTLGESDALYPLCKLFSFFSSSNSPRNSTISLLFRGELISGPLELPLSWWFLLL
jgi:hypothetical protein